MNSPCLDSFQDSQERLKILAEEAARRREVMKALNVVFTSRGRPGVNDGLNGTDFHRSDAKS